MEILEYVYVITDKDGKEYLLKDAEARELITNLDNKIDAAIESLNYSLENDVVQVSQLNNYYKKSEIDSKLIEMVDRDNFENIALSKNFVKASRIDNLEATIAGNVSQDLQEFKDEFIEESTATLDAYKNSLEEELDSDLDAIRDNYISNTVFETEKAKYVLKSKYDEDIVALTASINALTERIYQLERTLAPSQPSAIDENGDPIIVRYYDEQGQEIENIYYVEEV